MHCRWVVRLPGRQAAAGFQRARPQSDGHDGPRLIDEFVPSIATVVEYIVVGEEHAVGEPVVAGELPEFSTGLRFHGEWIAARSLGGNEIAENALVAATGLCLASCGSPYNTGDRALSGGLIGGAGGAAVGGLAGGEKGALIGGGLGAGGGAAVGAATTPRPSYRSYSSGGGYTAS